MVQRFPVASEQIGAKDGSVCAFSALTERQVTDEERLLAPATVQQMDKGWKLGSHTLVPVDSAVLHESEVSCHSYLVT